jgi:hypothetical protein
MINFFRFSTEGMLIYSSMFVYLFLFFQSNRFRCAFKKLDQEGNQKSVTSWTSLVRKNSTEISFKEFIDHFYHPVVCMLSGRKEARINEEVHIILHLFDLSKTID